MTKIIEHSNVVEVQVSTCDNCWFEFQLIHYVTPEEVKTGRCSHCGEKLPSVRKSRRHV